MRYLVKARVKRGMEKALRKAIEEGSLGRGSIAGDEYLWDMEQARLQERRNHRVGGSVLLRNTLAGGTSLLGRVLRIDPSPGRPFASQLPARERHRTVGLQQLHLHTPVGGALEEVWQLVYEVDFYYYLTTFIL